MTQRIIRNIDRFDVDYALMDLKEWVRNFMPRGQDPTDPFFRSLRISGMAEGLIRHDRICSHGHDAKHPKREGATST